MTRTVFLFSIFLLLLSCVHAPNIERKYYNPWEEDVGYAQVIKEGKTLYLSGITGQGDDMESQINAIYQNITQILKDYSATTDNIVKEQIYTTNMKALKQNMATRKKYFNDGKYPTSSWIEVKGLFMPEMMIEVEVKVILPK